MIGCLHDMEELISVRTEILTKCSELGGAWSKQYGKLARVFADMLGKKVSVTAEIGCGDGQLAIPLAKHTSGLQFVLVDRFADTVKSRLCDEHCD